MENELALEELFAHLMGSGSHIPYQSWPRKTQEPSAEHSVLSQTLKRPLPHCPQEAQGSAMEEELEDAKRLMTSHRQVPPPPPAVQICPEGQAPLQSFVDVLPLHGRSLLLELTALLSLESALSTLAALLTLDLLEAAPLFKRKPQFCFATTRHLFAESAIDPP